MYEKLNRRQLLKTAAATMTSIAASGADNYKGKIIDTHVHFYDPTRSQGVPWPPATESLLYQRTLPDRFRAATKGFDITGVVVVEASAWLEDNQWLLELAEKDKLIVGIVGRLEPGASEFPKHLERFAKSRLFRGIRLNGAQIKSGLAKPVFVEHIQSLAAADLQLDAIGGQAMLPDLLKLSDQAPKLRIVIDHMPFDPPSDKSVLRDISKRGQIYSKVSGVLRNVLGRVPEDVETYRAGLDELWESFGPDRLIYASNWPVSDKMADYSIVMKVVREYFAGKGAQAAEAYFFKNSLAAYKWVTR